MVVYSICCGDSGETMAICTNKLVAESIVDYMREVSTHGFNHYHYWSTDQDTYESLEEFIKDYPR